MTKKQVQKVIKWSTIALIIPILGQLFVDGWNWGLGEFVFAWVFFNLLGFSYTFVTNKIAHRIGRIVAELVLKVKESTERQAKDLHVKERLSTLYDEMLEKANHMLVQNK